MYIARETTELSYKAIGESFGKDHATVLHNVQKIEDHLKKNPFDKELIEDIIKNLQTDWFYRPIFLLFVLNFKKSYQPFSVYKHSGYAPPGL